MRAGLPLLALATCAVLGLQGCGESALQGPEAKPPTGLQPAIDQALTREQITHDIKIYPNTRHSFFNDTSSSYDQQAADDSWHRVMEFFGEQLGKR